MGFRVWGVGFRVWGLGFRAWGLGFGVRVGLRRMVCSLVSSALLSFVVSEIWVLGVNCTSFCKFAAVNP